MDQNAAETIPMRPFHDPTACSLVGFLLEFLGLFAPRANMGNKHIKDRIRALPVRDTGPSASKAVRIP
jgi:hypothetical protein